MSDDEFSFLAQRFPGVSRSACLLAAELAQRVEMGRKAEGPFVLGISGAQGSGKSTLASLVQTLLAERKGMTVALLSLDDFYLTKAERNELARAVHPLCATRGVAGTHDAALMLQVLDQLDSATEQTVTPVPRFDKLTDDRLPVDEWHRVKGKADCIIIEGWCVGLRAEHLGNWSGPINSLEATEDSQGIWARWSAGHLPDYTPIWDRIDLLLGIILPDLETVVQSRLRQELGLVEQGGDPARAMNEAQVRHFVAHYERHTRAIWAHFTEIADLLVERGEGFTFRVLA